MGIVETDAQDRFIAANRRACQILGYRCEQMLAMSVLELTYPEDRAMAAELNAALHEGRENQIDYEKRYLKADGTPVWVHVTGDQTWASTLVADGKVYMPTERFLYILSAGRQLKVLDKIRLGGPIWASPVAANGFQAPPQAASDSLVRE